MYPFESSVATNRGGKLTASASSGGELVHTDDKHHLKKDYWVPSKSMPSEGRQSEWTIRAIYLIGFVVKSIDPLVLKLGMISTNKVMHGHSVSVIRGRDGVFPTLVSPATPFNLKRKRVW